MFDSIFVYRFSTCVFNCREQIERLTFVRRKVNLSIELATWSQGPQLELLRGFHREVTVRTCLISALVIQLETIVLVPR